MSSKYSTAILVLAALIGALSAGCAGSGPETLYERCLVWAEETAYENADVPEPVAEVAEEFALDDELCEDAIDRGLVADNGAVAPGAAELVVSCRVGGSGCTPPHLAELLIKDPRYQALDPELRAVLSEGISLYADWDGNLDPRWADFNPYRTLEGVPAWAKETGAAPALIRRTVAEAERAGLLELTDKKLLELMLRLGDCPDNVDGYLACGAYNVDRKLVEQAQRLSE